MQRRVGGHMYDRQRWSKMYESLIRHFNYTKIVTSGWFLISFIHVPVKNAKLFLEGSGEKGRYGDTCMTCKCATSREECNSMLQLD